MHPFVEAPFVPLSTNNSVQIFRTAADNRRFVETVLYKYRAGIRWRALPKRFGDWKNVHRRLRRWCESGIFMRIYKHLTADTTTST
jgi:transposase